MEIKRCYDTIVGASVGENQLVQSARASTQVYGLTITRSEDGTADTITGTATDTGNVTLTGASVIAVANHVYLGGFGTASVSGCVLNFSTIGVVGTIAQLIKPTASRELGITAYITSGATINITVKPHIIDLTKKLGSSIADYIYSLESATAGSGISKLREWGFLKGYQAFNAGSIESVEVTGKKVRGFNQWNEEWELGVYANADGNPVSTATNIRSKSTSYIPVIPNATYYFNTSGKLMEVYQYDADKGYISKTNVTNQTVTFTGNVRYIRFDMASAYGTTYNHDICISLSSDRNGEYEPYTEQSYDYGTDTLNGIFKLDANNNLYADGDVKTSDGTIARRYGYMLLNGSEEWSMPSTGYFALAVNNLVNNNNKVTIISNRFVGDSWARISGLTLDNVVGVVNGATVRFRYSTLSDVASWKSWLNTNNTAIVYELATPTTETSTPFPSPQVCYPDGTEEYVTSNGVPVGHETRYEL